MLASWAWGLDHCLGHYSVRQLEEKQSSQVVKALVEEQKMENKSDDAIAQTLLQSVVNQPEEPTSPQEPKE